MVSVKDGSRNLPLKFGQHRVSNSWDIPGYGQMSPGKMFQWGVSRVFQGNLKNISMKFYVYKKFWGILKFFLKKLQECWKEVSGKIQGCFKKVSRVFQVRLKGVPSNFRDDSRLKGIRKKFKKCVREVSMVFQWRFKGASRVF